MKSEIVMWSLSAGSYPYPVATLRAQPLAYSGAVAHDVELDATRAKLAAAADECGVWRARAERAEAELARRGGKR